MTNEIAQRLGRRVLALRNGLNWTQRELAERAFISRSYVAHIEEGRNLPSFDVVRQLARALGTTAETLLFDPDSDASEIEENPLGIRDDLRFGLIQRGMTPEQAERMLQTIDDIVGDNQERETQ